MNRFTRYTGIALIPLVPLAIFAFFGGETQTAGDAFGLIFASAILASAAAGIGIGVDKLCHALLRRGTDDA